MTTTAKKDEMLTVAEAAIAIAKKGGANEASARAYRSRQVDLEWRDGSVERVSEATTRGVMLQLFVDGRYSNVSTSDLRPDALKTFINDSIALTRTLARDPYRALPDPALYKDQAQVDLRIEDPKYSDVTPEQRRKVAREIEEAARAADRGGAILSVSSGFSDELNETFLVTSNGFAGHMRNTGFYVSGNVSVKDQDGRRPEDGWFAGARFIGDLPSGASVGSKAAERALNRLGAKKTESAAITMIVDPRAGGRLMNMLLQALYGSTLQQKRSFLEGKLGQSVASANLTITDDPLMPKGFGSRLFDNEGIASKPRVLFDGGTLRTYFIDTYYGRKLKMAPTTASPSNFAWKLGTKDRDALLKDVNDGILVTGFLGGNSNSLTGDFSLGVQGFRVRGGARAEPIAEMNVSGNQVDFWKKLVAVGNDSYPYSALRTPTLVFDGISFAGL